MRSAWRGWALWALPAVVACGPAWGGVSLGVCTPSGEHPAAVQDRLIQVAGMLKAELDASGRRVAIVARSGQALQRLGHRYSHAGVSLKASPGAPWAVRQLYYACDEQRPRLFDQGLSGFVMGTHDPGLGHVSVLLPPPDAAASLERAALDDGLALQLLGQGYSANAHAFALDYQNCNQWVAELLATAWQPAPPTDAPDPPGARALAQRLLRQGQYQPSVIEARWPPLALAAAVLPWFHTRDHPPDDVAAGRFRVSMPASLAAWVQARQPGTWHWELCHTDSHVLIRRNGAPLAADCQPETGDEVRQLLLADELP